MDQPDIKRKAEMFVAAQLKVAVPGVTFYPSRHAMQDPEATELIPPYAVVESRDAEKMMANEDTWMVAMGLGYVTHIEDPYDPSKVRDIQLALEAIKPGYDGEHEIVVHGLDVSGVDDFEDSEKRARGDVISFTLACSG